MKIDFHTHYSKEHFNSLCERARKLGLDGLVMEGIPFQESFSFNSLVIFPAQEVQWIAAMHTPVYATHADYYTKKQSGENTDVYRGKALVILPLKTYKKLQDDSLFDLFKTVHDLNGIVIALQDNSTNRITSEGTIGNLYQFDAVRIRPFNEHDLKYEITSANFTVAGSDATKASELTYGKGFTELEFDVTSTEQLIDYIKNNYPTKLYVHTEKGMMDIKETTGERK